MVSLWSPCGHFPLELGLDGDRIGARMGGSTRPSNVFRVQFAIDREFVGVGIMLDPFARSQSISAF